MQQRAMLYNLTFLLNEDHALRILSQRVFQRKAIFLNRCLMSL
jgi:hypothetical protein